MIKKLQTKIILINVLVLLSVFLILLVALNLYIHRETASLSQNFLLEMAQNDGYPKSPPVSDDFRFAPPPNDVRNTRPGGFFFAKLNKNKTILEIKTDNMYDFSYNEAVSFLDEALQNDKVSGKISSFQYLITEKDYGYIIVFAESSFENILLSKIIYVSLGIAGISCFILVIISFFLSKWIVKPVQDAFVRQQRFISDASHELKTPLTIISANTDVLENEIGHNIRLDHIRIQIKRMNSLVNDLLNLAKSDEQKQPLQNINFNLSQLLETTVLEFESRFYEEYKQYISDITKDIFYQGDIEKTKQLLIILIDNAIVHSKPDSVIEIVLKKNKQNKTQLTISNDAEDISAQDMNLFFDRFYRTDESRSRNSGGYGLGLSIAKSIIEQQNGRIKISSKNNKIEFIILF